MNPRRTRVELSDMSRGTKIIASVLVIAILASAAVGLWVWKPWGPRIRPDIQKFGGTILTYEADTPTPLDVDTLRRLVARLQDRFERAGARDVNVRPVDDRRVAIDVPATRDPHRNGSTRPRPAARTGR